MNVQLGGGLYVHFMLTNACYRLGHIYKKQSVIVPKPMLIFLKWNDWDVILVQTWTDLMHIAKRCVFSLKLLSQAFSSTAHR